MCNILIVEDNPRKLEKLKSYITHEFPSFIIEEKTSYNSASREIALNYSKFSLILLDVSMQTYEISSKELGGDPEPLAGKNILNQMYLRDIPTKVLVVTMYENFVDGSKIRELDIEFKNNYLSNYCGYVFFSHGNIEWQEDLKKRINEIVKC